MRRQYCDYLCQTISAMRDQYSVHLWAYVFMPNHVHLLLYPTRPEYDLGAILQSIKQSVSRKVIRDARESSCGELEQFRTGVKDRPYRFWQKGGGYDRNIVSKTVVRSAISYIHNNPVRAGLVKSPEDWEWSSFRDWEGLGAGPIFIDRDYLSMT